MCYICMYVYIRIHFVHIYFGIRRFPCAGCVQIQQCECHWSNNTSIISFFLWPGYCENRHLNWVWFLFKIFLGLGGVGLNQTMNQSETVKYYFHAKGSCGISVTHTKYTNASLLRVLGVHGLERNRETIWKRSTHICFDVH